MTTPRSDARPARSRRVAAGLLGLLCVAAVAALWALEHFTSWLPRIDRDLGRGPQQLTVEHDWLRLLAHGVEFVFLPRWWLIGLLLVAIGLWVRRQRRAAYWLVGVSIVTNVLTGLLKQLVDRHRPVWPHPIETIHDPSFPSGHASQAAASMGVLIVLELLFIRRRSVRRLLIALAVLVIVVVGLDRVFLGVHNPSDVLAGWLLGGAVVLIGLAVFDPRPRSIAISAEPLPEVFVSHERHLAVVLNPIKVDDPGQFRAMVETMADEAGYAGVSWWQTSVDDPGHGMAHRAAVSGAHLVVAVGGDGTIRAVCEELAGTGVPVGIVPAGTGNLLARNLDIPLYLRAAVDVALNGQDRAIDMVAVSGDELPESTFLVMAGMGFDAAIMEGVSEHVKARVGWLAYVWSALKALMYPAIRVEVSVDGAEFTRHRARTVVIGNVGYLQAGMPLIPEAALDDGELDVVLLYPRRFLSWLPLAARILTKDPRTDETITRIRGRSVVIRSSIDTPRQIDGDPIDPGRELRAECLHGRLLVRVPR